MERFKAHTASLLVYIIQIRESLSYNIILLKKEKQR